MSDAGSRVSSIASSPLTLSSVSVWVSGAFSPTSGILSSAFVVTWMRTGAPTSRPFWRVANRTAQVPGLSKRTLVE